MTVEEFSNEFDVLVDSYRRFKDFDNREMLDSIEFSEYEKSLYLTRSQEELVASLYSGRNETTKGFEEVEELRRYLSDLVEEAELEPITVSSGHPLGIESNSKFFTLPENLWFITYEAALVSDARCTSMKSLEVVPVTQDEYHRLRNNPFRGPGSRRALRLDLSDGIVEIVSSLTVTKYYLRYLQKLSPIVLVNLPNEVSVDGVSAATECQLNSALHRRILENAVRRALQSKGYMNDNNENR